jgi:hypothetical protein
LYGTRGTKGFGNENKNTHTLRISRILVSMIWKEQGLVLVPHYCQLGGSCLLDGASGVMQVCQVLPNNQIMGKFELQPDFSARIIHEGIV